MHTIVNLGEGKAPRWLKRGTGDNSLPIAQYIQYSWDAGRERVAEFYSYTFQEFEDCQLVPNMQVVEVVGKPIDRRDLEDVIIGI